MPQVVFRICPACGDPTTEGIVELEPRRFVCDVCTTETPIEPLPPVLFLTGASGAGKTTLYEALVGQVDEALLVDQDLLWGLNPAYDDPESGYRQFRGLVLHLAERLARNGKPVLIEGSCMPEQYESLGERWYFAHTAYLAIVCSDDELARRLRARSGWRDSSRRLDEMIEWNRRLREHDFDSDPPIEVLDTTGRTVADCAAEVHSWIRHSAVSPPRADRP
jgi:chloramphenicol 3-O-phosphotransferase